MWAAHILFIDHYVYTGETSDSFLLLMIDTLFLYVLVHAKGWGAANYLAVREKILSEEE